MNETTHADGVSDVPWPTSDHRLRVPDTSMLPSSKKAPSAVVGLLNHAGSIRGQATAQVKRPVKAAATEATNENIRLWSAALSGPAAKKTRKR